METRMVDKNGMRAGAGLSAVLLLIAFVGHDGAWRLMSPFMGLVLGMGSVLGLRYSPLGATYRFAKKTFKLKVPVELEEEPPPRFAQTLGFVVLSLASIAFALSWNSFGWVLTLLVAALQGLLAATGLCVGCEIYMYGRRFAAKGA
jgi:hypothetical protein